MITLWFALVGLAVSCLVVSLVYALISPGSTGTIVKETAQGFGIMMGGIILLAALIELIGWFFGG